MESEKEKKNIIYIYVKLVSEKKLSCNDATVVVDSLIIHRKSSRYMHLLIKISIEKSAFTIRKTSKYKIFLNDKCFSF